MIDGSLVGLLVFWCDFRAVAGGVAGRLILELFRGCGVGLWLVGGRGGGLRSSGRMV